MEPLGDSPLMESLKPQLNAMNEMYKAAFEEGRRSAFAEMLPVINKLSHSFESNFLIKNEGAETLLKQQGDSHGTQSDQTRNR